jgi:hypothetical protein
VNDLSPVVAGLRGLAVFVASWVVALFVFWFPPFFLLPDNAVVRVLHAALALVAGFLAGRWMWRNREGFLAPTTLAGATILGAIGFGTVTFALGFFGPILLTPDANQGPLLGIFITGPVGLVAGGIGGAVWWLTGRRDRGR